MEGSGLKSRLLFLLFIQRRKDAKTQRGPQRRKDHNPDASPGFRSGIVSPEKSVCINNENELE
jgi:hypothetical protein